MGVGGWGGGGGCWRIYRVNMGLYTDNGKENGSYYLGFRGLGFPKIGGTVLFAAMRAFGIPVICVWFEAKEARSLAVPPSRGTYSPLTIHPVQVHKLQIAACRGGQAQ